MHSKWTAVLFGSLLVLIVGLVWGWVLPIVLTGLILLTSFAWKLFKKSYLMVPEMEVAVVFSTYGKAFSRFLSPGLHWLFPGLEYVHAVISTGPKVARGNSNAITKDGHCIYLEWTLTYRLNPERLAVDRRVNMARTLPNGSEKLAQTQVNDCLRELVEKYTIDDLIQTGVQGRLKREVRQEAAERLTLFGFEVYRIILENVKLPPGVIRANEEMHRRKKYAQAYVQTMNIVWQTISSFDHVGMERLNGYERLRVIEQSPNAAIVFSIDGQNNEYDKKNGNHKGIELLNKLPLAK